MIGIVVSRADSASRHIGEHLLDLEQWSEERDDSCSDADGGGTVYRLGADDTGRNTEAIELREFDELHLQLGGVDETFSDPDPDLDSNSDLIVFVSRHAGGTGPLLSAHVTGNFGPAKFGGHDHTLARAAPNAQAKALAALTAHAPSEYDVGLEGTHHGPTALDTPSLFVELGSDEPQWNDPKGARAVARAILDLRVAPERDTDRTLVGFGGGHYVPRFERVVRDTDWTVGHIGVDWALDEMGNPAENSVIEQAFERSNAEYALLDNPLDDSEYTRALTDTIERLGYRTVSEMWVRETTGVPLGLVTQLERNVETIENGLRFGDRTSEGENEIKKSVDLPSDLLAEANGIDHERTLAAIRERAVAVTTVEGGTQLAETVVLSNSTDRNDCVEILSSILETKYATVERDGNCIVAHEVAFSPALARELGVPEGPAFGRLSNGQSVEIDDNTVSPSDVREQQTHMFSLL